MAIDKNGFLWIGTKYGLNVYDGYSITNYYKDNHPQLASDQVIHLTCDSRNRIWLGSYEGVSWLDEKRNFHQVVLFDSVSKFGCRTIQETKTYGIILYTSLGQFYFDSLANKWKQLDWIPAELEFSKFLDAEPYNGDKIIYCTYSEVLMLDYATRKISYKKPYMVYPVSACRMDENEIAVGLMDGTVQFIIVSDNKVIREYKLTNEFHGEKINTDLSEVRRATNGDLIVATGTAGLITIDKSGNVKRHTHDPINSRSISANNTYRALPGSNGEVIVGTITSGIGIYNVYNRHAGYTKIFNDQRGNLFDNYLTEMAEGENGIIWIGTYDRLIRWDKKNNKTKFYYYYYRSASTFRNLEIRALCIDRYGRVWVSPTGDGIAVLNESEGSFRKLKKDTSLGMALKYDLIYDVMAASDGMIWGCNRGGIFRVDPNSFKMDAFSNHPVLKHMSGKNVISLFEDKRGRLWMGTRNNGTYCYDKAADQLYKYTEREGMISNTCFGFQQDTKGTIYVGSQIGFSTIENNGTVQSYTRGKGLRYDRCEGFLEDDLGYIWIANSKCLAKFDHNKKSFQFFDENVGLSMDGFREGSCIKTRTGELIWGSQSGVNYFFTGQLINNPAMLHVNIYKAVNENSVLRFNNNQGITLPYAENNLQLHFTAINLEGSRNIMYQYMLEGYDKNWQKGTDIREARYSSIPPGKYTFKVSASIDGISWIDSNNTIFVVVTLPFWKKWWFIALSTVIIGSGIYLVVMIYDKKLQRQKEKLERERAINYFATSMHSQQSVDAILWDVAKNCIGRLKFEDCVVYLLDEDRNVLVQKAAHGSKSPRQFEITQPLEIPLGKGIVGNVAANGKAEIIADTSKDARYIVDDERRYSEISVPIMSDGKVLGIIDCEHSKKGFFTQKHLSILTTIASLCANKIIRVRAEGEKKEAEHILMATKQKMSEVEMQALRAQMNPHFIFNCLNSINRYIVKSDQITASLYLTRFAKLIRLILDNSNSKNVILSNELEALRLYIEMESLRFDKKFDYTIQVDEGINTDSIEMPPLIIQPYVENAIWHGLLHKEESGRLDIHISLAGETILRCIIQDNGVGREKAKELRSKSATTRKSLGLKLTEDRINLLNEHARLNASIEIIDLKNELNQALGTKVILRIPI